MKNTKFESGDDDESDGRSFKEDLQNWFDKHYPDYSSFKDKHRLKKIVIILLIPLIVIGLVIAGMCLISAGPILESFYFSCESEAELDETLLDELFYILDLDSRMNVTNETYFLVLSIPELDYSIRFDYLFEFTSENQTNLKIEERGEAPKIKNFEIRQNSYPYNLTIEFHINSNDPDILNITIFPPDNVINGNLSTWSYHQGLFVNIDEGEVIDSDWGHEILALPYNQTIIGTAKFDHICPFR